MPARASPQVTHKLDNDRQSLAPSATRLYLDNSTTESGSRPNSVWQQTTELTTLTTESGSRHNSVWQQQTVQTADRVQHNKTCITKSMVFRL